MSAATNRVRAECGSADTRTNERGNVIHDGGLTILAARSDDHRYRYDSWASAHGFAQYDTDSDAHYFGVWVDVATREILSYCEGDLSVVCCPSLESFRAELGYMASFYGPPPPAFIAYGQDDAGTWTRTEVAGDRVVI